MADFDNDRTVIVERDTAEAASPLGWIVLLVALLLIIAFFFTNGFGLMKSDNVEKSDTTAPRTSESMNNETAPADKAPATDTPNDANSTPAPDTTVEPTPDTQAN